MITCTTSKHGRRGLSTYPSGEDCFWAPLDVGVADAVHRVGCIKLGIHQTDLIGVDQRPWSAVVAVVLVAPDAGRVVRVSLQPTRSDPPIVPGILGVAVADHGSHLVSVRRRPNYPSRTSRRASRRYSLPMIAGEKAPDFTLYDHAGRPRTLSVLLADGPVVLFFFPIASSPICTAQACHFRNLSDEFAKVGAQRVGISTDTVDRQAHFARQRSFDYPLLSDADSVVSELFGVRRGRLAKLRRSVVAREAAWRGRHTRRRGLLARVFPVRRTTFVIDTDRTILKVVSSEVRASVHADETLWFLENRNDARQQSDRKGEPIRDWFTEPETADEPSLVRPYTRTTGRVDSGVDLALEAPVEALNTTAKPPRWRRNDVRGQILTSCVHNPSVAEIASRLSLPLGATRFLVDDLVTQGYLRVHAPLSDSMTIDERRELITRTLRGLRALSAQPDSLPTAL
jgi:peroxiredoxin Q/BCP